MFRKKLYSVLCAVLILAFAAGCGSAPAQPAATEIPPQPAATQIPATPTLAPPTAAPVETDVVATKPEEISGWWSFSYTGMALQNEFHPDGKIFGRQVENDKTKAVVGSFWFADGIFHINSGCGQDNHQVEATYEAHLILRDGQNYKLYFNPVNETCKDRANEMKKGYLWVGPSE